MVDGNSTQHADEDTVAGKPSTVIWKTDSGVWVNVEALWAHLEELRQTAELRRNYASAAAYETTLDWLKAHGG